MEATGRRRHELQGAELTVAANLDATAQQTLPWQRFFCWSRPVGMGLMTLLATCSSSALSQWPPMTCSPPCW
jgi:hypothetical protein